MREIEDTRSLIAASVQPRPTQLFPLSEACGRVLAESVIAPADSPAFDHSAMDGYALASVEKGPHRIVGTVAAGDFGHPRILPGQVVRIFTGAPIPEGTLCVVPQEYCESSNGDVLVKTPPESGACIRRRGGSFRFGDELISTSTRLTPGSIALLASCGYSQVRVHSPVSALHIATGSELVQPPASLEPGQIYDSNGPMMRALLADRGVQCETRAAADDADHLLELVTEFTGELLLISGGSGPGDHDHTTAVLEKSGYRIHVSRVNSRPGKPMIFATHGEHLAFGLPGNPLSHWVCFHVFVAVALAAWNGLPVTALIPSHAKDWSPDPGDGRRNWTPATHFHKDARLHVQPLSWQHSGDLLPLVKATALLLDQPDPQTGLISTLLL